MGIYVYFFAKVVPFAIEVALAILTTYCYAFGFDDSHVFRLVYFACK